jgi:hypothetical protein
MNDLKFQRVIQDNEDFKRNVRLELEGLKTLLHKQISTSEPMVLDSESPPTTLSDPSSGNLNSTLNAPSNNGHSSVVLMPSTS